MNWRELFLKWINEKYSDFNTFDITFNESENRFNHTPTEAKWEAWQASANREGYKLVPVDDLKHIRALNKDTIEANEKYLKEITSTLGRIVNEMIEGSNE